MTDESPRPPAAPVPDAADFLTRYRDFESRAAELHPANKAALFAVLQSAGIAKVIVTFDGYGDSGQVEDVTAFAADEAQRDLPDTPIEIQQLHFGQAAPVAASEPLVDAIETLAYALLASTHCGWENNEGAFGEFTFDVEAGTISLDYNERFESSENYTHEF